MHPADELQLVREQIRALRQRETALRDRLIETEDRTGRRWAAEVQHRVSRRIDAARLSLSARADPRILARRCSTAVTLRAVGEPAAGGPAPVYRLVPIAAPPIRTGSTAAPSG